MSDGSLQAEVERLRAEVEFYKQREVESLKAQLAAALQAVEHYRAEAHRINTNFQEYVRLAGEKVAKLENQIATREQINRAVQRANTSRN